MSTIVISNIKATGETASRAVSGVAAAWVNFNGTSTVAVRDSVNVASLTDNGTGTYVVNLSNAFGAADYSATAQTGIISGNADVRISSSGIGTGTLALTTVNGSQSLLQDNDIVTAATHGDLA